MKKMVLTLIQLYQGGVSPFLPSTCRFYPSCSAYTKEAVESFGPLKGVGLGVKRLLKCHPGHAGGVDFV